MTMSQSYTLQDLLDTLEKKASDDTELTPEEKAKLEKEKAEADEKADGEKSEKSEKKEEGQEKSASEAGADLAKEVFEKVAHLNKENEMNKQASYAGKALADAILTKLASAGDLNTENGVAPGATPMKIQQDAALLLQQDAAKYQATPGTDGAGNGGSVNQIFDSIVQDAMSEGATAYDQTASAGASGGEGQAVAQGSFLGQNPTDESQEKMAAALTLMENGFDFDQAVALVKEAEEAIWAEEDGQIKQAAVGELMAQGFDFEDAVELIKEAVANPSERVSVPSSTLRGKADRLMYQGQRTAAGVSAQVSSKASQVAGKARSLAADAKNGAGAFAAGVKSEGANLKGAVMGLKNAPRMALRSIAGNRIAQGAAALAGAGAAGYALTREKKAAFDALVDAGVDFEKAASIVAAKSMELYGE